MSILTYPRSIWTPQPYWARQRNAAGQRIRVDGARMNAEECCCGGDETIECPACGTGYQVPLQLSVDLSGVASDACISGDACSGLNGNYVLDFISASGHVTTLKAANDGTCPSAPVYSGCVWGLYLSDGSASDGIRACDEASSNRVVNLIGIFFFVRLVSSGPTVIESGLDYHFGAYDPDDVLYPSGTDNCPATVLRYRDTYSTCDSAIPDTPTRTAVPSFPLNTFCDFSSAVSTVAGV